jgi:NADH-quinone oxidoreductase subunit J
MGEALVFYPLAAVILGSAVAVITARNPVHSVLFLVLSFLCVAGLYVTLHAEFLAVIQVMVYAGGIVVLYLFVVMLVNLKRGPEQHVDARRRGTLALVLSGLVLAQFVAIVLYTGGLVRPDVPVAEPPPVVGNVQQVGWVLLTDYLIPFELASFLLLVAMIGAIVLARRQI